MAKDSKDPSHSPFGIPGAGNLHDVMESMQKAWGFAGTQPMAPTLDLEEIDQRLKDLNAVAQWLALNQNMLQSSIQALQVQRATLVAFQSFSGGAGSTDAEGTSLNPMDLMAAFSQAFTNHQSAPGQEATSPPGGAAGPAPDTAVPPAGSGMDPQQWWAMLQEQFAHVASAALNSTDDKPGKSSGRKQKSPARPSIK